MRNKSDRCGYCLMGFSPHGITARRSTDGTPNHIFPAAYAQRAAPIDSNASRKSRWLNTRSLHPEPSTIVYDIADANHPVRQRPLHISLKRCGEALIWQWRRRLSLCVRATRPPTAIVAHHPQIKTRSLIEGAGLFYRLLSKSCVFIRPSSGKQRYVIFLIVPSV